MQEKSVLTGHLSELKQKIENGLEELKSSKELYEFKSEYLEGKKSKISGLMKEMKNIAPEERANYGHIPFWISPPMLRARQVHFSVADFEDAV